MNMKPTVLWSTQDIDCDIGSNSDAGSCTVGCLWPVTNVVHLNSILG